MSNTHYCHLKDSAQIEKAWQSEGIVSKLADFGESRSTINQTAAIRHTRTTNFERGTLVYNPPEMLTAVQGSLFSLEGLKHADVWSLGMLMFVLINPDLEYPYAIEMEQFNVSSIHDAKEILQKLMYQHKKPTFSTKYSTHQSTDWILIHEAFKFLTSFQPFERSSAIEVFQFLETKSVNEPLKSNSSAERINDKGSSFVSKTPDEGYYSQIYSILHVRYDPR